MYLANDVIQNSKKKGPEYNKEFGNKLGKVFEHLGAIRLDDKSVKGLNRLLDVWEERNVFEGDQIKQLKQSLGKCYMPVYLISIDKNFIKYGIYRLR